MKITDDKYFGLHLFTQEADTDNSIFQFVMNYSGIIKETMGDEEGSKVLLELSLLLLDNGMANITISPQDPEAAAKKPRAEKALRTITHDNTNYMIKDEVQELSSRLKLKNFTLKILDKLETQKSTYILDKKSFFRFYKLDNCVVGGFFKKSYETDTALKEDLSVLDAAFAGIGKPGLHYNDLSNQIEFGFDYYLFKLDLDDFSIEINDQKYYKMDDEKLKQDPEYPRLLQFIQLVTFISLSELELRILAPNMKCSNPGGRFHKKIINGSTSDVVIVGSKWNTISVREEGFKVAGFFRLQPCGKGRQDVKLIFVNSFMKHGYIRRFNRKQ